MMLPEGLEAKIAMVLCTTVDTYLVEFVVREARLRALYVAMGAAEVSTAGTPVTTITGFIKSRVERA